MKRSLLVLGLALALSFLFVSAAYANFGPHGGYANDTDSCAGCHRAHSSFSSIKFAPHPELDTGDPNDYQFALLVGNAGTIQEFCDACHGDLAPGASTNVQSGVFDSGPSGATGLALNDPSGTNGTDSGSVAVQYRTSSTFNAPLNGGGFGSVVAGRTGQILDTAVWEDSAGVTRTYKAVTSAHTMEASGILWGAGASVSNLAGFTCTNCHDPHGSSNYRLLRDGVNGAANTGGYVGDTPQGAVFSNETGYPATGDGGWMLHQAGATQMAAYRPNYTSGSADIMGKGAAGATGNGSLSSWCAGCHTQYNINGSSYDYGLNEGTGLVGARQRHRHPVDMTVAAGDHNLQIFALDDGTGGPDTPGGPKLDNRIPLEVDPNNATQRNGLYVGCLTCHFAHGGTALMSGWSNAHLVQNTNGTWVPQRDGIMGVDPDKVTDPMVTLNGPFVDQFTGGAVAGGTSALLRADNRGVCERCHNK